MLPAPAPALPVGWACATAAPQAIDASMVMTARTM
jgi:hypothetical protein